MKERSILLDQKTPVMYKCDINFCPWHLHMCHEDCDHKLSENCLSLKPLNDLGAD